MTEYVPKPIDTSDVELDGEITALGELLAKNTHEVWSANRMRDGWSFGKHRDDEKMHHPGLVPYEQLDERERDYDRCTSIETLKVIVKLGYKIVKEDK